jgi:DNA-binding LytR/AlgR family response regulator
MTAIIIEDESLIAKELQFKIAEIDSSIKILTILPSVKTARTWLMENAEPDLVFADIQLNDGVSFEIFEKYQLNCPIIFTTAYDEFAIKAFKVNGVDYLLKPIDNEELKIAIDKAKAIVNSKSIFPKDMHQLLKMMANPAANNVVYKEKFVVKQRNNWLPIATKDIACFYRDNLNYLITFEGQKHILEFVTLEEIEELLDPKLYYRANRQSLVHIDAVQSIKLHENQKLTLTLKAPIKMEQDISREKAPGFKKWFER